MVVSRKKIQNFRSTNKQNRKINKLSKNKRNVRKITKMKGGFLGANLFPVSRLFTNLKGITNREVSKQDKGSFETIFVNKLYPKSGTGTFSTEEFLKYYFNIKEEIDKKEIPFDITKYKDELKIRGKNVYHLATIFGKIIGTLFSNEKKKETKEKKMITLQEDIEQGIDTEKKKGLQREIQDLKSQPPPESLEDIIKTYKGTIENLVEDNEEVEVKCLKSIYKLFVIDTNMFLSITIPIIKKRYDIELETKRETNSHSQSVNNAFNLLRRIKKEGSTIEEKIEVLQKEFGAQKERINERLLEILGEDKDFTELIKIYNKEESFNRILNNLEGIVLFDLKYENIINGLGVIKNPEQLKSSAESQKWLDFEQIIDKIGDDPIQIKPNLDIFIKNFFNIIIRWKNIKKQKKQKAAFATKNKKLSVEHLNKQFANQNSNEAVELLKNKLIDSLNKFSKMKDYKKVLERVTEASNTRIAQLEAAVEPEPKPEASDNNDGSDEDDAGDGSDIGSGAGGEAAAGSDEDGGGSGSDDGDISGSGSDAGAGAKDEASF